MIKQHPIQLLTEGKILCGKVFSNFVAAWNWLISSLANIRGDADLDPQNGFITRDDSGSFPVLRLTNLDKLGGSGGGSITVRDPHGASATGDAITLASKSDANVDAVVTSSGSSTIIIQLGAYWL